MRTKLVVMIMIGLLAIALTGCAGAAYAQATPPTVEAQGEDTAPQVNRTLNVNGSGKVTLTPDVAYITIGVHTEGPSATEAMADNNKQAEAVIGVLKGQGIADKDIQTTNLSIYPQQIYDDQGKPTGEIRYTVDNSVYVTLRDITTVGDVLDAVVKAGANTISGIQFDVSEKSAALSTARAAAVADAKAKAEELAKAAGVTLGQVQTISEYTATNPIPMYDMRVSGAAMAEAASVPVQAGQMLLTMEVNIVYEIR